MFGTRSTLVAVLAFFILTSGVHAAAPTISFESPRGGEVYGLGQVQKVRLGAKTKAKVVKIELSRDGGTTFELLGTIDNSVKDLTLRNVLSFTVGGAASSNCVIRATGTIGKTEVSALSSPFSIGSAGSPAAGSVTSASLASGAVVTAGLADGSVTNTKLAAAAVSADKMTSGAASSGFVATADGAGGVAYQTPASSSSVAASAGNSVITAINDPTTTATINGSRLAAGSVTSSQIADGTVDVADLSATVDGRYVKKAGDTMTGALTVPALTSSGDVTSATFTCNSSFKMNGPIPGALLSVTATSGGRPGTFTVINGGGQPALQANSDGNFTAFEARASGAGQAAKATNTGTGIAGEFRISNTSNANPALFSTTTGTGNTMLIDHQGASGNIALFTNSATPVARIDKTGKGFFNGGTQTSGADVAEAVAVTGDRAAYEPGDVLALAAAEGLRFEKCGAPYSTLVAGVYATKPGVLLTERDATNDSLNDLVPMGVVGIIPTKVCGENGPIKIGDLLVTSSKAGHAMRGTDKSRMLGAIIGKAMEPFEGAGGVIKVLVNVK